MYICSLHREQNRTNEHAYYPAFPLVMIIINYDEHPDDPRLDPLIRRVPFPFRAGLNLSGELAAAFVLLILLILPGLIGCPPHGMMV